MALVNSLAPVSVSLILATSAASLPHEVTANATQPSRTGHSLTTVTSHRPLLWAMAIVVRASGVARVEPAFPKKGARSMLSVEAEQIEATDLRRPTTSGTCYAAFNIAHFGLISSLYSRKNSTFLTSDNPCIIEAFFFRRRLCSCHRQLILHISKRK